MVITHWDDKCVMDQSITITLKLTITNSESTTATVDKKLLYSYRLLVRLGGAQN